MKPNPTNQPTASFLRIIFAAIIASLSAFAALAENLDWDSKNQSFQADFDDTEIRAVYTFKNTSDKIVEITDTSATCGCTVPSLEKNRYEPGETGKLDALFTIGSRQGKQRKVINVKTTDASGRTVTYELQLNVDIPVPVTFKPRVRFWKLQKEATSQEIEVSFHKRMPMELSELSVKDAADAAAFDYEIETLAEGLHYKIILTPKTPNKRSRAAYYLVSQDDEKDILKRYPIYAYVR